MMRCPVYQCSGTMKAAVRPYPKGESEMDYPNGMPGDDQLPDLVCQNCHAVYRFQYFERKKDNRQKNLNDFEEIK